MKKYLRRMTVKDICTVLLAFIMAPPTLYAYSFTPEAGIEVRQESNVTKDSTEQDDTIIAPYVGLSFSETNATINTHIDLFAEYEDYQDNTFSSQEFYDVNAFLDFNILPERLVWAFEDYANTQRIDILGSDVADNLQNVNVFSTGPDLIYQYNIWTWLAKLRYGDVYYADNDSDSNFYNLTGAVRREINEYSRATLGLAYRSTDYDARFRSDYDLYKSFISYSRDLPTGDFLFDFGLNKVEFDSDADADDDDPYLKLLLSFQPVGELTFNIDYIDEYTDSIGRAYDATSTRIIDEEEAEFTDLSNLNSTGIYRVKGASVGMKYGAGGRLSLGLRALSEETDYFQDAADSDTLAGNGYASFLITELLSFTLGGSYQEVDFDETLASDAISDEITAGQASFNYRFTDNIFTRIGYRVEERTSTDLEREYENDIVFFTLGYRATEK